MAERLFAFARTLAFFVVVPGTFAWVVPRLLVPGPPGPLAPLGAVVASAGIALLLCCGWNFAFAGRGTPAPFDAPRELVATGPYRYVRNPMYLAVLLIIAAEALAFSLALLAYGALLWVAFHGFVLSYEERALAARFGSGYQEYKRRVPRWIPRLRPG